jgi:hypothetical protein
MRGVRAAVVGVSLGVVLALPAVASAATTLGETFEPFSGGTCQGNPTAELEMLQTGRYSGPSYQAPSAGVLTSWSFQAGPELSHLTLRLFRPTSNVHEYFVVADDGGLKLMTGGSGLNTFPIRIPVARGDIVGIHSDSGSCGNNTSHTGSDTWDERENGVTPVGSTGAFTPRDALILDISAQLEPDADRDGYGDETQDKCPSDPATQATCPVGSPSNPGSGNTLGGGNVFGFTGLAIPGQTVTASKGGKVQLDVGCPAAAVGNCAGTDTLKTTGPVALKAKVAAKKKKKVLTLGSSTFSIKPGTTGKVTIKLSKAARKLLAKRKNLNVLEIVVAHDSRNVAKTTKANVTLKAPKAKKKK